MSNSPSLQLVLQPRIQAVQTPVRRRSAGSSDPGPGMHQRMEMVMVGGATTCIFERTQALLDESSEHVSVLERLAGLEVRVEYRSMIDLLFFELYPEWKPVRNWFYNLDEELPVSGYISRPEIRRFDASLIVALEIARQNEGHECMRSWRAFRSAFRTELAKILR